MKNRPIPHKLLTRRSTRLLAVLLVVIFGLIVPSAHAQNVSVGSYTADPSSLLDMTSTAKGLLIPRVSTTQKLAIAAPATGLLVFDVTLNMFYYYDGTAWVPILSGGTGWNLIGNSNTNPNVNFLGTIDSVTHLVKTYSRERIRTRDSGSVQLTSYNASSEQLMFQTPNGSSTTSLRARNQQTNLTIQYQLPDTGGAAGTILYNDGSQKLFWARYGYGANRWGIYTLPTLTHDTNDYDLYPRDGNTIYRLSGTANILISGITGGWDGRVIVLVNVNTIPKSLYLQNESTLSQAVNRIRTGSGGQVQLNADQACYLFYDGVTQRWRVITTPP